MNDIVEIKNPYEMISYYRRFFGRIISGDSTVLYVGYEDDDILIPLLADLNVKIVAIDREERFGRKFQNVHYKRIDFLNLDTDKECYDCIIFSFVLHENDVGLHREFIELAKKMSSKIIIIEPLARTSIEGKWFEKKIETEQKKYGIIKKYYSDRYWKTVSGFEVLKDDCIILKSNYSTSFYDSRDGEQNKEVSVQDIIILVCGIERK